MGLLRIYRVLWVGVLVLGVFASACVGVEPPFSESSRATDREGSFAAESQKSQTGEKRAGSQGKSDELAVDGGWADAEETGTSDASMDVGVDLQDVDANVGLEEAGDMGDFEGMPEGTNEGCVQMCELLESCHGLPAGVADIEACRMGCGQSAYDGVLTERDLRCVKGATDCRELAQCMQGFRGCDEPCDAVMRCGLQEEPDDCRLWCGVGIGSGAVRIEQFHCMEELSNTMRCEEMVDVCELSWLL